MQPIQPKVTKPPTIQVRILINFWNYIRDYYLRPIVHLFFPSLWVAPVNQGGNVIKPTSAIPGPHVWPFIGDALTLNQVGGAERLLDYVDLLHKKYGVIVKSQLGPQKFVFVNHPQLYKEIIRTEPRCPASFKLPASATFDKQYNIDRGLFFQDGEIWYHNRALLTQLILKETGQYMETLFELAEQSLQKTMTDWTYKCSQNNGLITTIEQDCYEFFISSIMVITYGPEYEKFLAQADSDVPTLAARAIKLNTETFDLNAFPIKIATTLRLKCWEQYKELTMYNLKTGWKCTDVAMEAMSTGGSLEEFGLLHRFKNVCNASIKDMRVNCTDFTSDISDPHNHALDRVLTRNPEVQDGILEEIERICGSQRPVKYKDLEKMSYVNGFIKEVLRMYTTAPLIIRSPLEPVVIGGYMVTPDYSIVLSTFSSHKNPAYFSEPEKFWPHRWILDQHDPTTGAKLRDEDAYHPFGIGKRSCAGKLLALGLLKLFTTRIVQNFLIKSEEVKPKLKIILFPDSDMKITLKPRILK